ncbi:hypothetical protein [Williamwhitmania taraxaci]|uniref:Uncharacterized protein n=1 Tax=Williamwhitmania taraxaci TaxID=1640674 RepID=A0A1G6GLK5_9BACT|nr:hypothetical protein [Williamwhitmania taraxaci]SDB82814.1 hypothetical protein SAMN05216323_100230 [Williamwhitmania taraxaci]
MKINIICYEDVNAWILGKFAKKMHENLTRLGIESKISKCSDPLCDINHHIIYINFNGEPSSIDTLMVTHIDDSSKLNLIKRQLDVAQMGICMSHETMVKLVSLGISKDKLSYINPAHDGVIKPRKIVIGITCMVQDDGRKREVFLDNLAELLDPNVFMFRIMGRNWDKQVATLISNNFVVEYESDFDYDKYVKLIPSLDYYLYMGQDEGQMGFVDALSAGVKTITTPQGYHLDAINGITHPFSTYNELVDIFISIQNERYSLVKSVESWNWMDYTRKHVELWEYLLSKKNSISYNLPQTSGYEDGIFSVFRHTPIVFSERKELLKLRKEYVRHLYYKIKNRLFKL